MTVSGQIVRPCPKCGRPLHIRVEYAGMTVACPQCGGRFLAHRPGTPPVPDPSDSALLRAEQLLQSPASDASPGRQR